jgi:D-alanyl-lipoteichoic acid acyltransferase DltB (MBOAT superfamily)
MVPSRIGFLSYFLYVCSLFTFVSGPIQRYEDFSEQVSRLGECTLSDDTVQRSVSRIVNGLLKVVFVSVLFLKLHETFSMISLDTPRTGIGMVAYWGSAIAYALYMYSNFSGYMDVVIGLGVLFGFSLPENFNHPFDSANFLELWSRWHITLSRWFQIYVFNPAQLALHRRWPNKRLVPYFGVAGFFLTFLLMGLWHGSTLQFLLYGIMLGAGTSANRLYQVIMQQSLGKKGYAALKESSVYTAVCMGMTFSYFALALTFVWADTATLAALANRHGIATWLLSGAYASIVCGLILTFWKCAREAIGTRARLFEALTQSYAVRQGVLSVKVALLIAVCVVGLERSVEFVYQAF